MTKDADPKIFDTRVIDRNIKKGLITKKDYDVYLKQLANDEDNFDLVPIEDENAEGPLSEEEIKAMPEMTPEQIENFDFLENEKAKKKGKK